jgi:hypothetical protein
MAAFYRREREHGVMGSAAGARLMPAKEGERRSGLSAEGCVRLQALTGALDCGGLVWCRGKQVRAAAAAISSPRHGLGQSEQGDIGGWTRAACRAHGTSRFPSVGQPPCKAFPLLPLQDSARMMFHEMPART